MPVACLVGWCSCCLQLSKARPLKRKQSLCEDCIYIHTVCCGITKPVDIHIYRLLPIALHWQQCSTHASGLMYVPGWG